MRARKREGVDHLSLNTLILYKLGVTYSKHIDEGMTRAYCKSFHNATTIQVEEVYQTRFPE